MRQMTCNEIRRNLALWVGNDLEEPEVAVLRLHLADCSACRAHWQALQEAQSVLQTAGRSALRTADGGVAETPRSVWPGVSRQMRLVRQPQREPDIPSWTVLAGWAAACAAVVWLGVMTPFMPSGGGNGDWAEYSAPIEAHPVSSQTPLLPVTLPSGTLKPEAWPAETSESFPLRPVFHQASPRSL